MKDVNGNAVYIGVSRSGNAGQFIHFFHLGFFITPKGGRLGRL